MNTENIHTLCSVKTLVFKCPPESLKFPEIFPTLQNPLQYIAKVLNDFIQDHTFSSQEAMLGHKRHGQCLMTSNGEVKLKNSITSLELLS